MPETQVHNLGYGQDEIGQVRAKVFAVLVRLTTGVVEQFVSDLYHDAKWLDLFLIEPMEFNFSCDAGGTYIGTDQLALYRANKYRCTVAVDERRRWTMTVTPV